MIQDAEVRAQLIAVIQKRSSVDAFEDWLVQRSWNMHLDSSLSARKLVASVELALAEYSSDHRSLAELLAEFVAIAEEVRATVRLTVDGLEPYQAPTWTAKPAYQRFERLQVAAQA